MHDLSVAHDCITDLFPAPRSEAHWSSLRLTPEQIRFFHEHGYIAGTPLLNDTQLAALRDALTRLFDPEHPGNDLFYEYFSNRSEVPGAVLFHALGAWRIEPAFHDLLWNPAFLVPAAQLLDGAVRFWHDQLFCKPPGHGATVAWHQDYSYWTRTAPMAHLTCWIGLDNSTRDNGCLWYVPGSHRWDLLPITGLTGDMEEIRSVLTEEQKTQFRPVPVELRAGQCSFHHPLMVHGSYANCSDRPRRATVINVFRDGVLSNSDEELLKGVSIPKGSRMDGQLFPLLAAPASVGSS